MESSHPISPRYWTYKSSSQCHCTINPYKNRTKKQQTQKTDFNSNSNSKSPLKNFSKMGKKTTKLNLKRKPFWLTNSVAEPHNSTNLFPNRELCFSETTIQCGHLHGRSSEPATCLFLLQSLTPRLRRRPNAGRHRNPPAGTFPHRKMRKPRAWSRTDPDSTTKGHRRIVWRYRENGKLHFLFLPLGSLQNGSKQRFRVFKQRFRVFRESETEKTSSSSLNSRWESCFEPQNFVDWSSF